MKLTANQREILNTIEEFPGITTKEISHLTSRTEGSVKNALVRLETARQIIKEKKETEGIGRSPWAYSIGLETKAKPKKKETISDTNLMMDMAKEVAQLRLWQERAILRYPDLKIDPVVLEARELFATHLPDQKQRDECLAGMLDKRPPMLALIEALSR